MGDRKAFLLRIDPKVWAEVESWAADELRSVNSQVEYLLREALRRRRGGRGGGGGDDAGRDGGAGGSGNGTPGT